MPRLMAPNCELACKGSVLFPVSNSALNRTPNIDCYWVGAVPNVKVTMTMLNWEIEVESRPLWGLGFLGLRVKGLGGLLVFGIQCVVWLILPFRSASPSCRPPGKKGKTPSA